MQWLIEGLGNGLFFIFLRSPESSTGQFQPEHKKTESEDNRHRHFLTI
ncbi:MULTISPECIES: hypothetical protein [Streptococcus]|uniref:Uncharacterized protein n=1 Tax=Streptococcus caledonicus TaxID=2614158 RepID=A0ABW0UD77_9STRE|nr:hypothetical protein [Streptococcus sp. S784/96/1]